MMKHTAVFQSTPKPINTNSTAANTTRILYSAFRKAFAPSRIAEEISCIRSVPSSSLPTLEARTKAKSSATMPSTGAKYIKFSIIIPLFHKFGDNTDNQNIIGCFFVKQKTNRLSFSKKQIHTLRPTAKSPVFLLRHR